MPRARALIVTLIASLLLAACKIEIKVPANGGTVETLSGDIQCPAGDTCTVSVVDLFFDQTFIGAPAEGFQFTGWARGNRRFCGGSLDPCRLFTAGFEGNAQLESILNSNEVFFLTPEFAPGNGTAAAPSQVKRVLYDNDSNGTLDAVATTRFNSQGRIASTEYRYSGDSTRDRDNVLDDDAGHEISQFTYNGQGRVAKVSTDRDTDDGPERFVTQFTYTSEGGIKQVTFSQQFSGQSAQSGHMDFIYNGGELRRVDTFSAELGAIIQSQRFVYGSNGLPATVTTASELGGFSVTTKFTWRPDGQLAGLTSGSETMRAEYDNAGRLVRQVWSDASDGLHYGELSDAYTVRFERNAQNRVVRRVYDIGSDGSEDIRVTMEFNNQACHPSYFFAPNALPQFTPSAAIPLVPGTGVFRLPDCGVY